MKPDWLSWLSASFKRGSYLIEKTLLGNAKEVFRKATSSDRQVYGYVKDDILHLGGSRPRTGSVAHEGYLPLTSSAEPEKPIPFEAWEQLLLKNKLQFDLENRELTQSVAMHIRLLRFNQLLQSTAGSPLVQLEAPNLRVALLKHSLWEDRKRGREVRALQLVAFVVILVGFPITYLAFQATSPFPDGFSPATYACYALTVIAFHLQTEHDPFDVEPLIATRPTAFRLSEVVFLATKGIVFVGLQSVIAIAGTEPFRVRSGGAV
jgi:hypothetical protein